AVKINWHQAVGYMMIVTASCFWGGSASFGKQLMLGGLSTIRLMEIRSVVSSLALLILLSLFARKHLRITWSDLPGFLLLSIPGLALVNASYYKAVQLMPVAIAAFIQFTAPVLIFLYGLVTRTEKASAPRFLALVLGLAGTYLMLELKSGGIQQWPVFGLVCALASMVSYAFYVLVSHRLGNKHSPWTLVAYGYGLASVFWCIVENPFATAAAVTAGGLWQKVALFSLFSTLIPFMLFLTGLRRVSPTGASIASTSETVMAALFAFLFLGETLAAGQILGAVLIIAAVTILVLQPEPAPEVIVAEDHPA
ncbi:MAG TPA: EamA family transporter, partial [Acidobacteriota bacterium]|nr:EamA family transporter [Acidobacteriota bacterium]